MKCPICELEISEYRLAVRLWSLHGVHPQFLRLARASARASTGAAAVDAQDKVAADVPFALFRN